ncbi:MAG: hypothetical protein GX247_04535 [Mollicutes bacterium]|nr:hypothetical protein [Mollicutes bacterium]
MNKEYDVIELENGNEYVVIDEITKNNNTYVYLVNEKEATDFCIRKLIDEGTEKVLIGLDNEEEFRQALLYFTNKNNI